MYRILPAICDRPEIAEQTALPLERSSRVTGRLGIGRKARVGRRMRIAKASDDVDDLLAVVPLPVPKPV